MEARRLVITGVVQGVGFRYHISTAAMRLGISGWVRNRVDGSVEAMIAGDPAAIAEIIHCARQGPAASRVARVLVEAIENHTPAQGFTQLSTA